MKIMIALKKDKKSSCWIIEVTNSEGFHDCLFVTKRELIELRKQINNIDIPYF